MGLMAPWLPGAQHDLERRSEIAPWAPWVRGPMEPTLGPVFGDGITDFIFWLIADHEAIDLDPPNARPQYISPVPLCRININ